MDAERVAGAMNSLDRYVLAFAVWHFPEMTFSPTDTDQGGAPIPVSGQDVIQILDVLSDGLLSQGPCDYCARYPRIGDCPGAHAHAVDVMMEKGKDPVEALKLQLHFVEMSPGHTRSELWQAAEKGVTEALLYLQGRKLTS